MEKCNTFRKFSAVLSPELVPLKLTKKKEHSILTGLYGLAELRIHIEHNRLKLIEELKHLNLRLKKYKQLATAIKKCQDSLEKALKICSQLPPAKIVEPVFTDLLEYAKEMVDEARQDLEDSRLFYVGWGMPLMVKQLPKELAKAEIRSAMFDSWVTLQKRWKKSREDSIYIPATSYEEWLENIGGSKGFHKLSDAYGLEHLRAMAADHWLIHEADSFLKARTDAGTTMRFKIISKLFMAAFNEGGVSTSKVKMVLSRAEKKPVKNPRLVSHVSKIASKF